jgi:hypothetical protein
MASCLRIPCGVEIVLGSTELLISASRAIKILPKHRVSTCFSVMHTGSHEEDWDVVKEREVEARVSRLDVLYKVWGCL